MFERRAPTPFASAAAASLKEALLQLALDLGIENLTVDLLSRQIGMEKAEFERVFGSVEACCLRLYEDIWASLEAEVAPACESASTWREQVRGAAYAAARWVRDNPQETRFAAVEMLSGGELAQAVRDRRLEGAVNLLDQGRNCLPDPASVGRSLAIAIVGSVQGLLTQELSQGRGTERVEELVPELMYIAVRPYMGEEAARDELSCVCGRGR